MKKTISLLCVIVVLAMLFGLCACGANTEAPVAETPEQESTAAPEKPAPEEPAAEAPVGESTPQYGGTLRVLTDTDGSGVIGAPWEMSANGAKVLTPCIDTLVKMDTDCTIYPCLAESWELAEDKSSITFQLREDVSFSDGSKFDAEAAVWNLNKWKEGGTIGMCYAWSNIEVIDEYSFRIDLLFYQNNLLSGFTEAFLGFISPTAFEEKGLEWCESNIVSTGPFVLESLEPGVGWSYSKNESYWGAEPYLDAIEFTYVGDKNTMKLMMLSGEADLITWDSSGDADIKNELVSSGFHLIGYENGSEPTCLYFDSSNPDSPFADARVRQAVDYCIDKEAIAALGGGLWDATYQMVGPDSELFDAALSRSYDPEKAKELLAEAGYPDGFSTQVMMEETADKNLFVAVIEYMKAVGIQCELVINPTPQQFGAAMGGWSGMIGLPCPVAPNYPDSAYSFLGQNGAVAVSLGKTDEMESLLQAAYSCELGEEQHEYVKQFLSYVYEECAVLPMMVATNTVGVRASYVHDDGWGSLTQGYWTPALCWLEA